MVIVATVVQLERQKQALKETMHIQERYQKSIQDINDRLDAARRTLNSLVPTASMTSDQLNDLLSDAEVDYIYDATNQMLVQLHCS